MSVRVGESWTARNGHRRWISVSGGDFLLGAGVRAVFVLPLLALWWLILAEFWLVAESVLIVVSTVAVLVALARREAGPRDVRLTWLRWGLFMADLRGRP